MPNWQGIGGLIRQLGGPEQALSAIMGARGENPGESYINPALQGMSPTELGLADRYASAQTARNSVGLPMALAGITLGAVPYEGAKALEQTFPNFFGGLNRGLGTLVGRPDFGIGQATSPASLDNISAYYQGLFNQ